MMLSDLHDSRVGLILWVPHVHLPIQSDGLASDAWTYLPEHYVANS